MLLRKRSKLNKGYKMEKLSLKEGDTLLVKYPTDEWGSSIYDYEMLTAMHDSLRKKFDDVMLLPDNLEFNKIQNKLDNSKISIIEINEIKNRVIEENGYIDEWVEAECWQEVLKLIKEKGII